MKKISIHKYFLILCVLKRYQDIHKIKNYKFYCLQNIHKTRICFTWKVEQSTYEYSSSHFIWPLSPKITALIRTDFRCTKMIRYILCVLNCSSQKRPLLLQGHYFPLQKGWPYKTGSTVLSILHFMVKTWRDRKLHAIRYCWYVFQTIQMK